MTIILPIMLALCLMLSGTYYAQSYASIIGWCLPKTLLANHQKGRPGYISFRMRAEGTPPPPPTNLFPTDTCTVLLELYNIIHNIIGLLYQLIKSGPMHIDT